MLRELCSAAARDFPERRRSKAPGRNQPSGAGHDAMNVAKLAPTAMIFIPCVGGVSHSLLENVLEKDLRNSIRILYEVVMDICG